MTSEEYVVRDRDGWLIWAATGWLPRVSEVFAVRQADEGWLYRSKHARTRLISLDGLPPAYLKTYRRYRRRDVLKELLRPSKAERAFTMSVALQQAGFPTARVVVAAVRRSWGVVWEAFLVTQNVDGPDVRAFLGELAERGTPARKWGALRQLGAHVGRMHEAGFCHGDLVPANVRVQGDATAPRFVLLDHDRTHASRRPVALRQAGRNLIQLNRFVVTGLSATDRWRVFRAYCAERHLDSRARRRLARRIIRKTIERRRRFDGIEGAERMSFRTLMRTSGPARAVCMHSSAPPVREP